LEFAPTWDALQPTAQSLAPPILVEIVGKAGFIVLVTAQSLTLQEEYMLAFQLLPT
jgi:hypothetical protein